MTVGRAQGFAQEHGYNFEVSATAEGTIQAEPLKAMGRFAHEAIAVDPRPRDLGPWEQGAL